MRMAFVSQEYPPATSHGGIGTQTYLKSHGLAGLGHEVYVISIGDNEKDESRDGSVRVIRIPGFDHRLPIYTEPARWLTYSAEVAAAVWELHSQLPLDIVDFPEWGGEGFLHLVNRTEWNHIPTVIHLHGPLVMFAHAMGWPEIDSEFYRIGTMMEGTCLRLADAVISSSECSANWCAKYYGLQRNQMTVLHTGVDTSLFYPRLVPKESRPTIVFVGRVSEDKGVDLLLEASCRLAKEYPDLRLQMVGQGDDELVECLRTKASAAGFPELLDLPGSVDRRELPSYLSRAHVFAAPSFYEGGPGFVYLEAMACGLPVVACNGSGAAEVISEECGILLPPGDLQALVKGLRRLLSDFWEREAMGARARRYVLMKADSKICLRQLEDFYTAVAEGRPFASELRQ